MKVVIQYVEGGGKMCWFVPLIGTLKNQDIPLLTLGLVDSRTMTINNHGKS
jgi:hypothetical protein